MQSSNGEVRQKKEWAEQSKEVIRRMQEASANARNMTEAEIMHEFRVRFAPKFAVAVHVLTEDELQPYYEAQDRGRLSVLRKCPPGPLAPRLMSRKYRAMH